MGDLLGHRGAAGAGMVRLAQQGFPTMESRDDFAGAWPGVLAMYRTQLQEWVPRGGPPEEVVMALPEVVSREEWLEARVRLLAREKEQTRARGTG
ncbi:MAG: hypothetical protein QOG05_4294 [Streptosporangiaceae bacterium]|nr:hypothetical protein [Streptosporangiaceae bacterium]